MPPHLHLEEAKRVVFKTFFFFLLRDNEQVEQTK